MIDSLISLSFKGIAGLMFLAGISLLPFYNDWQFVITENCPKEVAET